MFEITINATIHFHQHGDGAAIGEVLTKLTEILAQQKRGFAMVRQDIKDFTAKVDAATTAISDRIDALIAKSTTLDTEEKAELQRIADHLDAMGKDPENPIPDLPVDPPTV